MSWGSHMSSYFRLANGVKQGGVISAQLFTLYIVIFDTICFVSSILCNYVFFSSSELSPSLFLLS